MDLGSPFGEVFVHAPEDLILYKLFYFSISQQSKHVRDIAAILKAKRGQLEEPYAYYWVDRLGVRAIWEEIRSDSR